MLCESLDLNHCTERISVFRYRGSLSSLPILRSARRRKLIYSKRSSDPEEQIAPRCTAVPFNIPVAGGEPITLALKYGNRAAGSAYRRLDKRCDARSIGPPTDRGSFALARASLLFVLLSRSSPPIPLALGQPAIICYVRDSKLTAILASCHSYVLPFISPVRRSGAPPDSGRTWSYQARAEDPVSDRRV